MIKFSVLIPNYGYSPYIFECLDSVVAQQNDGAFEYEIIMCDQSSLEVFDDIKQQVLQRYGDSKIHLIYSDIKGLLRARHTLIDKATGDYIVYIDSDDWVDINYLFQLSNCIIENDYPDLVITDYKKDDENISSRRKREKSIFNINVQNNFMDYLIFDNRFNNVVTKIFKKELYKFENYNLFDVTNGEDKIFSIPIVKSAKKIVFSGIRSYNYRINQCSMTHSLNPVSFKNKLFLLDEMGINLMDINDFQASMYINNFLNIFFSDLKICRSLDKDSLSYFVKICSLRINDIAKKHKIKFYNVKNLIKFLLLKNRLYYIIKLIVHR